MRNCSVSKWCIEGDDPGDFYKRNTDSTLSVSERSPEGGQAPICFCFLFVDLSGSSLDGERTCVDGERERRMGYRCIQPLRGQV